MSDAGVGGRAARARGGLATAALRGAGWRFGSELTGKFSIPREDHH